MTADPNFPIEEKAVIATLAELFRHQNEAGLATLLDTAVARIEQTEYDNWNGGTYYYALHLQIPLKLFSEIEPRLGKIEEKIEAKARTAFRIDDRFILSRVHITPALAAPTNIHVRQDSPIDHIWKEGFFRLFLSHISAHKDMVSGLKTQLMFFGVSGFVAHQDIEPTHEWQTEIQLALSSMDALAAFLTPGYHESKWTDQEVGFALGRGILTIPVRMGLDPYGFIGKTQALAGVANDPAKTALEIIDVLLKHPTTMPRMRDALVGAIEASRSYPISIKITSKLESLKSFLPAQLERLKLATKNNSQIADAYGIPARIAKLIEHHSPH